MSAFGGKADIVRVSDLCLLLTQSGHWGLRDQRTWISAARARDYRLIGLETINALTLELDQSVGSGLLTYLLRRFLQEC